MNEKIIIYATANVFIFRLDKSELKYDKLFLHKTTTPTEFV